MTYSDLNNSDYVKRMNEWNFQVYDDVDVGERVSEFTKKLPKYHPKKSGFIITIENFWEYVEKLGENDCWEWIGNRNPGDHAYGRLIINGKRTMAHRIAYSLINGEIPKGYIILHKCDNPPCCNPKHLVLGTSKDNTHDMVNKGRYSFGPNCIHPRIRSIKERKIKYKVRKP